MTRKRHHIRQHSGRRSRKGEPRPWMRRTDLTCKECNFTAKRAIDYSLHMQRHREYKCGECGEAIVGYIKLKAHRVKMHPEKWKRTQEHACSHCGKTFDQAFKVSFSIFIFPSNVLTFQFVTGSGSHLQSPHCREGPSTQVP